MSNNSVKCFVIMPFSATASRTEEEWTRHYEKFLKPLIEECPNVEAFRSSPLRENVQEQIIKDLVFSPIVVAELTDSKPNVFWELGVRQSFKHGTVTIADEKTSIPFHLQHKSIIKYKKDPSTDDVFKNRFKEAIKSCINEPTKLDSPVLTAITGRGSIYFLINKDESLRKLVAIESEMRYNNSLSEEISGRIKENKTNREKDSNNWIYLTRNFNYSAIELLMTTRYLNLSSEEYIFLKIYYELILDLYNALDDWSSNLNVENYLLERILYFNNIYIPYLKFIQHCKELVENIV
jgi:hypothetical protein